MNEIEYYMEQLEKRGFRKAIKRFFKAIIAEIKLFWEWRL